MRKNTPTQSPENFLTSLWPNQKSEFYNSLLTTEGKRNQEQHFSLFMTWPCNLQSTFLYLGANSWSTSSSYKPWSFQREKTGACKKWRSCRIHDSIQRTKELVQEGRHSPKETEENLIIADITNSSFIP